MKCPNCGSQLETKTLVTLIPENYIEGLPSYLAEDIITSRKVNYLACHTCASEHDMRNSWLFDKKTGKFYYYVLSGYRGNAHWELWKKTTFIFRESLYAWKQ